MTLNKDYLTRKQIAKEFPVDISQSTIDRAIRDRHPMFIVRIFGKRKYYLASAIREYIAGKEHNPLTKQGNAL
jgi:hypothetical protein